jgi:hypothetical protein
MTRLVPLTAIALALAAAPARAQDKPADRPSDQDIFGKPGESKPAETKPEETPAPPPTPAEPAGPASAPAASGDSRDQDVLGERDAATRFSQDVAPEDPLKIGGMFYLRAQSSALQDQSAKDWTLSTPSLLDVYLDARPNDRVRGFVLGRMLFDPTLADEGTAASPTGDLTGDTMGTEPLSALLGTPTRGPHVALDQMWLRFDLKHTVFVTAGKQHVRWGTARFWTPTDFLHLRRRNPLDVFDARTGTTMIKLHLPWESQGWNFYAYGLTESEGKTPTASQAAGAARAEVVLGTSEIGLGALVQRGRKPKFAIDASTGIWDLDLYGELALRYGSEIDRINVAQPLDLATVRDADSFMTAVERAYPARRESGIKPQVVGGLTYTRRYGTANDLFNVGLEYFYNTLGYDSAAVYPGLLLPRHQQLADPATFFYLGRHYGALFINVPSPGSWDLHSFTLSTLGNFSDRSFISRFDYGLVLLTHLRFEAYVAVRFGRQAGEFRFAIPELNRGPGLLDFGLALRVAI